jgi:hypothetical protein
LWRTEHRQNADDEIEADLVGKDIPSGPRPPCRADTIGRLKLGGDGSRTNATGELTTLHSIGMSRLELGLGGAWRGLGGHAVMVICGPDAQPIPRKVACRRAPRNGG